MNKKIAVPVAGGVLLLLAVVYFLTRDGDSDELVLYGNVDLRQVELPFNDS